MRASFSPEQYEQGLLATEAEIASWQHAITSETVEQSIQSWLGASVCPWHPSVWCQEP